MPIGESGENVDKGEKHPNFIEMGCDNDKCYSMFPTIIFYVTITSNLKRLCATAYNLCTGYPTSFNTSLWRHGIKLQDP